MGLITIDIGPKYQMTTENQMNIEKQLVPSVWTQMIFSVQNIKNSESF